MASFDIAKLLNKITQDIPGINTVLKALAKWDLSALTDVPDGAMQATTDSSNRLTIKKKVSGSYAPVAKIMHDVDTVDGYHASESATANALAVRNASGVLPGNITGNAATADTATALATGAVVPVNQGGTGATTVSQARANLGVADGADFTTHIAKQASATVEGHVKLDALAANGSNTAAPGGFGLGTSAPYIADLDAMVGTGYARASLSTLHTPDNTRYYYVEQIVYDADASLQIARDTGLRNQFMRFKSRTAGWSTWAPSPTGITDSTATTSSTIAASATAVKAVNDSAVHKTGNEDIAGTKNFSASPILTNAALILRRTDSTLGTTPASNRYWQNSMQDSAGTWVSRFEALHQIDQRVIGRILVQNKNQAGALLESRIELVLLPDGLTYATCPTPPDTATSNQVATAQWVLSHSSAEQVGDIIASFAATRAGCLLMNGGAVSRTTYANLFAIIGTAFGAGDGTTTFNLPNARDRVLQGANSNLMQYLAAGLPNITGFFTIRGNQVNTGSSGGSIYKTSGDSAQNSTVEGGRASDIVNIDASRSSSKYGASATVQPAAITVNFFIKY